MTGREAAEPVPPVLARLHAAGQAVADYRSGAGLEATLSPRPFLHPVRTLAGTPVTDAVPADHRWHLGAGVAIQDVGGVNLWGGRTYRREGGYTWLDDHGHVEHLAFLERSASGLVADLAWRAPDGRELLRERRELRATAVDVPAATAPDRAPRATRPVAATTRGWRLGLRFTLRNVTGADLLLGSPASNGRAGAGYGGFFWRLPSFSTVEVRTTGARGEAAVHGRPAPWLAVRGRVRSDDAEVTLMFRGGDGPTRRDPWFVRMRGYPGVGSSLAVDHPVALAAGEHLHRGLDVLVLDGRVGLAACAAALDAAVPTGGDHPEGAGDPVPAGGTDRAVPSR